MDGHVTSNGACWGKGICLLATLHCLLRPQSCLSSHPVQGKFVLRYDIILCSTVDLYQLRLGHILKFRVTISDFLKLEVTVPDKKIGATISEFKVYPAPELSKFTVEFPKFEVTIQEFSKFVARNPLNLG